VQISHLDRVLSSATAHSMVCMQAEYWASLAVAGNSWTIKNTFLDVRDDNEEPIVRPSKSVPSCFRVADTSDSGEEWDSPAALTGSTTTTSDDGESVADEFAEESAATPTEPMDGVGAFSEALGLSSPCDLASFSMICCPVQTVYPDGISSGYSVGLLQVLPHLASQAVVDATLASVGQPRDQLQQMLQVQPQLEEQQSHKAAVASSGAPSETLVGRVWKLSQLAQSCRKVQSALETGSGEVREMLASELRGHVWEALYSPHANFVLQKCVEILPPHALQFVVDELVQGSAEKAAKHRYGCRVFQRLLERCTAEQLSPLVEPVIANFLSMAQDPFGNYVVQHLLEHGSPEHRRLIVGLAERDVGSLVADPFGSAVVSGGLSKSPAACRVRLARALLREPGALACLACMRHGRLGASRVLKVLHGHELEEARQALLADEHALRPLKLGRVRHQRS